MGMGPGMFDGLITGMIVIGILIGIAFCGVVLFIWWLFQHLSISWN
jgi:hypothetical protein